MTTEAIKYAATHVASKSSVFTAIWFLIQGAIVGGATIKLLAKFNLANEHTISIWAFFAVFAYFGYSIAKTMKADLSKSRLQKMKAIEAENSSLKEKNKRLTNEVELLTLDSVKATDVENKQWQKIRTFEESQRTYEKKIQAYEDDIRALKEKITSVQASIDGRVNQAVKESNGRIKEVYEREIKATTDAIKTLTSKLEAIETAHELKRRVSSANGRIPRATDDERALLVSEKDEAQKQLNDLVAKNQWLLKLSNW